MGFERLSGFGKMTRFGKMSGSAKVWSCTFELAVLACLVIFSPAPPAGAQAKPVYKVDPFWPKPLPNKWLMQGVPVMVTDKDDHIWVMNRPRDVNPDENWGIHHAAAHRLLHRGAGGARVRHRG